MGKSMDEPKIAVLMSAYNEREEWLRESIESVLNQTYRNIRLYIVLDDPDNRTLHRLITDFARKDSRIVYLPNERNMGIVRSLNRALELIQEPYVAKLDADDVAREDRLEKELAFLRGHDLEFVMAGADFIYENGERGPGDAIPALDTEQLLEVQKYGNVSIHSTWLLKRSVYRRLGGYREVSHCEDFDFVMRALQAQIRIARMEDHLVLYRLRSTSVSMTHAMEQSRKANEIRDVYRAGLRVEDLNVAKLNEKFGHASEREQASYMKSKLLIDDFCDKLYRKKYFACMGNLLGGMLFHASYRRLFWQSFTARRKLNKIYRA